MRAAAPERAIRAIAGRTRDFADGSHDVVNAPRKCLLNPATIRLESLGKLERAAAFEWEAVGPPPKALISYEAPREQ